MPRSRGWAARDRPLCEHQLLPATVRPAARGAIIRLGWSAHADGCRHAMARHGHEQPASERSRALFADDPRDGGRFRTYVRSVTLAMEAPRAPAIERARGCGPCHGGNQRLRTKLFAHRTRRVARRRDVCGRAFRRRPAVGQTRNYWYMSVAQPSYAWSGDSGAVQAVYCRSSEHPDAVSSRPPKPAAALTSFIAVLVEREVRARLRLSTVLSTPRPSREHLTIQGGRSALPGGVRRGVGMRCGATGGPDGGGGGRAKVRC